MGRAVMADERETGWKSRAWPLLRRAVVVGVLFILLAYAWQWLVAEQRQTVEVTLFAADGPAGVLPGLGRPA